MFSLISDKFEAILRKSFTTERTFVLHFKYFIFIKGGLKSMFL